MPKTLDQYFGEVLGAKEVQNTLLRAQLEAVQEQLETVTKELDELKGAAKAPKVEKKG